MIGGGNGGGGVARRAAVTASVDGGRGAQCGLSSAEAEGRFKLCGEALEVLGDAAKRALYDQVRRLIRFIVSIGGSTFRARESSPSTTRCGGRAIGQRCCGAPPWPYAPQGCAMLARRSGIRRRLSRRDGRAGVPVGQCIDARCRAHPGCAHASCCMLLRSRARAPLARASQSIDGWPGAWGGCAGGAGARPGVQTRTRGVWTPEGGPSDRTRCAGGPCAARVSACPVPLFRKTSS